MMRDSVAQYLKRIVMAAMVTMGLSLLVFSYSDAGPSSCADFNDPGAVFCDDFEDGDRQGWTSSRAATAHNLINVRSPGLDGSNLGVELFTPVERLPESSSQNIRLHHTYNMFVPNGEKFWVEWWGSYDSNFRWKVICEVQSDGVRRCTSSHKTFELGNDSAPHPWGRPLMTIWDGGGNGSKGRILWGVPESINQDWANVDPDFRLLPGNTYQFILEITSATGTAGGFKFWVNGQLLFDVQNIQTCTITAGCTWTGIGLGGAQAGVGPNGNFQYYDEVRITRTNIDPGASPRDTTAPATPTNLRVVQ